MSKKIKLGAASIKGLDVSHFEGKIDFAKVKNDGYSFVFIKATDGDGGRDGTYKNYTEDARAVGLVVGAYHFFHLAKDPIAQMDHLISVIGAHKVGDLPPVIDIEWTDGYQTVTPAGAAAALKALQYLEQKLQITPIIYTSASFFCDASNPEAFKKYPLWVPSYRTDYAVIPDTWDTFTFWQQTNKQNVSGIEGPVDANVFNGNMAQLMALTGFKVQALPIMHAEPTPVIAPIAPAPIGTKPFFTGFWSKIKSIF